MHLPRLRRFWVLFPLLLNIYPAAGQKEEVPKFKVRVNLVPLDVEVLDRSGNPVLGLKREDFVVKERGKVMSISNFARLQDRPVSLAVVLDTSAISLARLNTAKQFVFQLIHLIGRDDDICLYTFNQSDAVLEQDFTKDRAPLISALDNISVPSKGSGGILAEMFGGKPATAVGIDLALLRLAKTNNGKKALLVVSNRFRGLGPVTVEHVQESGCTLLTLGFNNKAAWILSLGGDPISRRQLMKESGGRKFSAETEDITGVCRAMAYSLKNYYALAYLTEVKPGEEKPRRIEVLVPGRNLIVNARRSYIPKEEERTQDSPTRPR